MEPADYSFLKNHFDWQNIPASEESSLTKIAKDYIKEHFPDFPDYNFMSIFYEKSTNAIISCSPIDCSRE